MTLLPITRDLEFDCTNYDTISGILMEVVESSLEMETTPPWCGYLALTMDNEVIGTCAFKGPPDERGEVELAWFTFPPYEHRGYGTQMAAELVRIAQGYPDQVSRLIAHTEPARKASARICEKLGFTLQGEYDHPTDGTVWYWTKDLA